MNTNLLRLTTLTVREAVLCRKRKILISQSLYEENRTRLRSSHFTLTTMKGIPLAYNKDMQEDKELVFDAIDTTKGCLALFTGMLKTMRFNNARMEESAKHGFTNATDAADYLVNHNVPFRDAHGIVGRLVLYCIEKNIALDDMSLEEFKAISPVFEEDIYEAISMKTCVDMRNTIARRGKTQWKR
mgnify:CR=1 FL=1